MATRKELEKEISIKEMNKEEFDKYWQESLASAGLKEIKGKIKSKFAIGGDAGKTGRANK